MSKAKKLVLVGQKFGRLTTIERAENSKHGHLRWLTRCDCGNLSISVAADLVSGHTQSCGCYKLQRVSEAKTVHGHCTKGISKTYITYQAMMSRCCKPKAHNYKYYGGRGIEVCQFWKKSFANFLHDMGEKPPGYTLDRIDVNKNYEPSNCKWSTWKEQANNRRSNIKQVMKLLAR